MWKKTLSLITVLVLVFAIGVILIPGKAKATGTLSVFSYSFGPSTAGASATYTFDYTTATDVPAGSYILYLLFPSSGGHDTEFNFDSAHITTNVTAKIGKSTLTIDTVHSFVVQGSGGFLGIAVTSDVPPGSALEVSVSRIINNTVPGTYTFDPALSSSFIKTADTGGNTIDGPASIADQVITADTQVPIVTMNSPVNNTTVSGTSVALSATASDDIGVVGMQFYLDGTTPIGPLISTTTISSISTFSKTWDTTSVSNGTHTITAVGHDAAPNYATSSARTVTVSNITAPVISSIASAPAANSATITWTTDENSSSKVVYDLTSTLNQTTPTTDSVSGVTSHSVTLSNLASCGLYHYKVVSDTSGAYSTSTDNTFITTCVGSASVSTSTALTIPSSGGATIDYDIAIINVPALYATTTSAVFQVKTLDPVAFTASAGSPSGVVRASDNIINLKAFIDATTTLSSFNQPITVTMSYDPTSLGSIDPSTLAIYRYDSGTGWTALSSCSVDTTADTVSCQTSNFSDFALFGTEPQTNNTNTQTQAAVHIYGSGRRSIAMTSVPSSTVSTTSFVFSRDLEYGMRVIDVIALQHYLNTHGFAVAENGPGSLGNETNFFGPATRAAVVKFQKAYSISPSIGYFGPITRGFVASHP